jgi:hypothetical protein
MNVHEIAQTLQQKGISQDTIILVYHKTRMDLKILRQLLESQGYDSILPPDEYYFPLIQLLRTNMFQGLSKDQQFPLKLEVVFLIMFPRHELIGLNHQALVDCQQTRLVCKAIDELGRPTRERGGSGSQTRLLNRRSCLSSIGCKTNIQLMRAMVRSFVFQDDDARC